MSEDEKWSQRRLRHCKQYGIKTDVASEKLRSMSKIVQDEDDANANSRRASGVTGFSVHLSRRPTGISRSHSLDPSRISPGPIEGGTMNGGKRETVLQILYKGINSVANGDFFRHFQTVGRSRASRFHHSPTVSRIPTYISVRERADRSMLGCTSSFVAVATNSQQQNHPNGQNSNYASTTATTPAAGIFGTTTIHQQQAYTGFGTTMDLDLETPRNGNGLLLEMDGLLEGTAAESASASTKFFLHSQHSPQEPQMILEDLDDDTIFDVLFFDQTDGPPAGQQKQQIGRGGQIYSGDGDEEENEMNNNKNLPSQSGIDGGQFMTDEFGIDGSLGMDNRRVNAASVNRFGRIRGKKQQPKKRSKLQRIVGLFGGDSSEDRITRLRSLAKFNFSIRRGAAGNCIGAMADDEEERPTKLPMYGRFISDPELIKKLKDDSCDYRPYFTYWISTVHVLVLMFMLLNYGIGTDFTNALFNTLGVIERSGDVMSHSLSAAHLVVWEQNNIWIGPKYADLVHAGAKYTPCMRRDNKIYERILQERRTEAETTGCCIGPWGCYQTSECPKQFAQLVKWVNGTFPESAGFSRVVCGQDPRYCVRPRSVHPFLWGGTNISTWPICEQRPRSPIPSRERHMHCPVTGRPCCIQMHGQCRIASREYCDFVGGYFHQNATLCSQVSCLNEVCGMTPFLRRDHPDQIFRLITPLFIHAGIIRCAISLGIYLTIMRRFEIMIGWLRLSTIYFVSGIGGYLASAVFVPYMPEVGPVGSEGGILGALIINILYNWDMLSQPHRALAFHLAIAGVLFLLGFLPWIDNWAQLFGFIFGSLMAIVLIPYITIGRQAHHDGTKGGRRHLRLPIVVASLCVTVGLFGVLFLLFFAYPINFAPLGLLNCPIPTKICDHQGLILRNWLPI